MEDLHAIAYQVRGTQESLRALRGRIARLKARVPQQSAMWRELGAMHAEFCIALASANTALAMLERASSDNDKPVADWQLRAANDDTFDD